MKYYHFTNWEPVDIEKVLTGIWPNAMLEYDKGNKKPLIKLFRDMRNITILQNGYYRLGGWHFSLMEYCKTYWVKTKHYGIMQLYAPDKTTIRNTLGKHNTIKIIEVME